MSLLSLPVEIFYNIIDHEEITIADLKCLRLVHPALSKRVAMLLFKSLSFKLLGKDRDRYSADPTLEAIADHAEAEAKKLLEVQKMKRSEMAFAPRSLHFDMFVLPKIEGSVTRFADAVSKTYPTLLEIFPNIADVHLHFESRSRCKESQEAFIAVVQALGKRPRDSLRLHASLINCSFGHALDEAYPTVVALAGLAPLESLQLEGGMGSLAAVNGLIASSPSLKSLELYNYFPDSLPDIMNVPDAVLASIRSLGIDSCDRGYLSRDILKKFTSLKRLNLDDQPQPRERIPTFWKDLTHSPEVRLESLSVAWMSRALLSYLSSPAARNLRKLRIVDDDWTHNRRGDDFNCPTTCRSVTDIYYRNSLPNFAGTVEDLTFRIDPYQSAWDGINFAGIKCHFNFVHKGHILEFPQCSFKSLKTITVGITYEAEAFVSLMKLIRDSPKLRSITVYADMLDVPSGSRPSELLAEIGEFRPPPGECCWPAVGLRMLLRMNIYRRYLYDKEKANYEFKGGRWQMVGGVEDDVEDGWSRP